jgi:wobble nucleotide-excising tRNase
VIKTILICNHKSFHPTNPCRIEVPTDKPATYIYGLNGAGKSAIAEAIEGISLGDSAFANCRIETTDHAKYRYMVYNHHFVDRVISEPIRGIFTVGEEDTNRQKRIKEIEEKAASLDEQINSHKNHLLDLKEKISREHERAKNEIWKAYELGKSTSLEGLLKGYGRDKEKFFRDLRTHALPDDGQLETLERLEKRWSEASGTENERPPLKLDTSGLEVIERDPIWAESVEVSKNSRLAPLVAELGNADWVARGQQYLQKDRCPFCQQGLPHDFRDELVRLLEGERKAKIEKISSLVKAYEAKLQTLDIQANIILSSPDSAEAGVEPAWSQLRARLHNNLARMQTKLTEPSTSMAIDVTNTDDIQEALTKLNQLIADFNARIRDRKGEQERIRRMFFQALHADRAEAYARHDELMKPLQDEKKKIEDQIEIKLQKLSSLDAELRELRRQQKGVDASIDAINDRLASLGITEFRIQRKEGHDRLYCLHRPGIPDCSPKSLSEGEKTLIAFLYFMEFLKGSHDEEEHIDPKRTIAVIDDPISSLSQNYVYDIATMINRELANPPIQLQLVKQVIVLTHNLFFFHELIRQHRTKLESAHKKCGLLRVVKNTYSQVQPLDPTALQNDYDTWWHILKDARDGNVPSQVVPNAMRNILEHFFTFTTGSSEFPEAVKKLANEDTSSKYQALERFMDRGSHRDGINGPPFDWTQYDVPYLLGKLRAMFRAIDQEAHYIMKMGEAVS